MKTLEALFLDELADMYDAENRLTQALPKMANAADHDELRSAFEDHLSETKGHVQKVQQVFKAFGVQPRAQQCAAMVGLLKEADEIASDNKGHPTLNAALISAAQKVEHYEIASYGCLHEWAGLLDNEEAADILAEILGQEKGADEKLTAIARDACNPQAEEGSDSDSGSSSRDEEDEDEDETGAKAGSGMRRKPASGGTAMPKRTNVSAQTGTRR
jgi:ferritin-like metal-binding protein YciE